MFSNISALFAILIESDALIIERYSTVVVLV